MGTKPRTLERFPRMKYRARKRDEAKLARLAWHFTRCVVLAEWQIGADGEWTLVRQVTE